MYDRLIRSFEECPVVDRKGYPYFVHPLTDGVPRMDPEVLEEVLGWIMAEADLRCDVLALPEAMGIPLGVPISLRTGIPYTVIRKKEYFLPGEVSVEQKTGYSSSVMHINGISAGDRVTIIDDVVSTGGTLTAIIKAIRDECGAEIADVVVPVDKANGKEAVERSTGVRVKTMVEVSVGPDRRVKCHLTGS